MLLASPGYQAARMAQHNPLAAEAGRRHYAAVIAARFLWNRQCR